MSRQDRAVRAKLCEHRYLVIAVSSMSDDTRSYFIHRWRLIRSPASYYTRI